MVNHPERAMEKKIGILLLENNPFGDLYGTINLQVERSLGNPSTFRYPVIYEKVPGATGDRVVYADKNILDAYTLSAMKLVEKGASVITANCGFTVLMQKDLADSVAVPVVTSSLLLIPFISNIISRKGRIGILTYDSQSLKTNYLEPSGMGAAASHLVVQGFQDCSSWRELNVAEPSVDREEMKEDLIRGCRKLLADNPNVEVLLLECTAMPQFKSDIAIMCGLPVFDIVDIVHFVTDNLI